MSLDLSRKVGPLPLGTWLAVAGGVAAGVWVIRSRQSSTPVETVVESAAPDGWLDNTQPGDFNIGQAPSNPTSGQPSGGGAYQPSTNEEWAVLAQRALIGAGYVPLMVDVALRKYLDGQALTSAEQALVNLAIVKAGPTPQTVPPPQPGTPAPDSGIVPPTPARDVMPPARPALPTPLPAPPAAPQPAPARTYTVVRGDTLSAIGRRFGVDWRAIYAANRAVIGANPNLIKPGQVLTIP